jgi:hypothetical protein
MLYSLTALLAFARTRIPFFALLQRFHDMERQHAIRYKLHRNRHENSQRSVGAFSRGADFVGANPECHRVNGREEW